MPNQFTPPKNGEQKKTEKDQESPEKEKPLTEEELILRKLDLLRKLAELQEQHNIVLTKDYTLESDYDMMKYEYELHRGMRDKKNSVKWYRSLLISLITGMEFLNERYNPFDFHLKGWSEQTNAGIDDYDDVFGELYEKYRGSKSKLAPELKLLFMLIMGAVTFHLSKSIFKVPGIDDAIKNNPEIIKKVAEQVMEAQNKNRTQAPQRPMQMPMQMPNMQQMQQMQQMFNMQQMPNMQMPNMQMPNMQMPNMQMPNMQMPNMQMPNMQMPNMQMPNVQPRPTPQMTRPLQPPVQQKPNTMQPKPVPTKEQAIQQQMKHQEYVQQQQMLQRMLGNQPMQAPINPVTGLIKQPNINNKPLLQSVQQLTKAGAPLAHPKPETKEELKQEEKKMTKSSPKKPSPKKPSKATESERMSELGSDASTATRKRRGAKKSVIRIETK